MNSLHVFMLFIAAVAIYVGVQREIDSSNPCSAFNMHGYCSNQFYIKE